MTEAKKIDETTTHRIELTGDAVEGGTKTSPAEPAPHAPDADSNTKQDDGKPSPAPEEQKPSDSE